MPTREQVLDLAQRLEYGVDHAAADPDGARVNELVKLMEEAKKMLLELADEV